jgi:acyl-[acyl-carrier-protein] desaturase
MSTSDAFREAVYREYMEFFEKAERNRRWNVFNDVPWDELDPAKNNEEAALLAETFTGVEMYLPDYVAGGINIVRNTFGQGWFNANWAYEESKHAFALREWLVKSGQRTQAQMFEFEKQILSKKWDLPFKTARQMTFYGTVQEQATFMMYKHQLELARERGDNVLATIYLHISKDEAAHADFYRKVIALELAEDREGTISDMAWVFKNFRMPADELVPDYEMRTQKMRESGGVDRGVFLKEVWFPTLKKLDVTRQEITAASAKHRKDGLKDAA